MTPARKRVVIVAAALATVLVVLGTLWALRGGREPSPTAAGGTSGMEGMDMSSGGTVQLTAAQLGQLGVTFGTVEERRLEREVRTAGQVAVAETRVAQVAPRFGGFVERLHADFTGQAVRRGQPLAEVYSPEVFAAQQELLAARELQRTIGQSGGVPGLPGASTDLVAAARRRLELWDVSDAQIDEVLRTGRPSRTVTLYAPTSGVVIEKSVVRGQAIQAGQTLYTIADLSEVWVEAELRELEAGAVRVGSGADIELAAYPGRTFKGRVEYVDPVLDTASRTVRARVAVSNPAGLLKPGMYATVRFSTPSRTALTVPTSAVIRTGERSVVFVDMGGGQLMPHEVETGAVAGDYTEVLSGVDRGHRVVTSAQFLLDSESNLAEVMRAMMGQMGAQDMGRMGGDTAMPGMKMPGPPAPPRR